MDPDKVDVVTKSFTMTVYELSFGGDSNRGTLFFPAIYLNDAITKFSEKVVEFDRDPKVRAAWVHLKRLADNIIQEDTSFAGWTKTSDERPTYEGCTAPL